MSYTASSCGYRNRDQRSRRARRREYRHSCRRQATRGYALDRDAGYRYRNLARRRLALPEGRQCARALVSVILGLVVGELLDVDALLRRLGDFLEERFSKGESPVSRAFVTTSFLFCVGPLTVIGSLQDGLNGDYSLLALKGALDFIAALAFASVLGCPALGRDGPRSTGLTDARGGVPGCAHNRTHDLVDDRDRRNPDIRPWPGSARPKRGQGGQHATRAPFRPTARRGESLVATLTYARAADTLVFVGRTQAQ
jgi:Protein of unknown function (DUF554)